MSAWKKASLEEAGIGWVVLLWHDLADVLDRDAAGDVQADLTMGGLLSPDGSLTERGEEARRAALRLLAERQVSPARIEALAGGVPALCAEVARLRAALDAVTEERDVLRSSGRVAGLPGKPEPYHAGDTPEQRERAGYDVALVTLAAWTCITGRPEDAARAFGALLGCAGESDDGRRGAARALMHCALVLLGREVPTTTVEHDVGELQAEAEANERPSQFSEPVHAGGIRRALSVLAPHLPLPRVRR